MRRWYCSCTYLKIKAVGEVYGVGRVDPSVKRHIKRRRKCENVKLYRFQVRHAFELAHDRDTFILLLTWTSRIKVS